MKTKYLKDKGIIVLSEIYSKPFMQYSSLLTDECHDLEYKAKLYLKVLNITDTCNFVEFLRFSNMYGIIALCKLEPIVITYKEHTTPIPLNSDIVEPLKILFNNWKENELQHLEPQKAKTVTIHSVFKYFKLITENV